MKAVSTDPISVHSVGTVKMDDRKRPVMMDIDDTAPPAKRHAASTNGTRPHPDENMPWKEEIEYYQKDAIFRQMREYKREKTDLESQVAALEKRSRYHDDHLRIIDSWFAQLLDEIKILTNDAMTVDSKAQTGTFILLVRPSDNVFELTRKQGATPFVSTILSLSSEKFQEHLGKRSSDIQTAIAHLFSKFPCATPESRQLQEQLAQTLSSEKETLAELHKITTEKDQLSERLENASYRYMVAEKKLDRAKSAAVAKLEQQAIMSSAATSDEPGVRLDPSADTNGAVSAVASEAVETARLEAISAAEKLKEHVVQLEAENKKVTDSLTAANARWVTLSDEDYAKTELFKLAKTQLEDQIKRINYLEATHNQLRDEAQKLQAERTAFRRKLEDESLVAASEHESQLARAETDVARLRNARDETISELQMKKAALEQQRGSVDQVAELAATRQRRIDALESESERLKLRLGEVEAMQNNDFDSLSVEELRSRLTSLQKQYELINNEMPAMTEAWRRAQALASKKVADAVNADENVSKLTAEKSKADQKFFASMKAKEARESEIRTLRTQNAKSSEIISQLKEAESNSRALSMNQEKQLAEIRDAHHVQQQRNVHLEQKATENATSAEGLSLQIAELKKQLVGKDSTVLSASHAQKQAEIEAGELKVRLAETKKSLEGWKKKGLGNQSEEYESLRSIAICTVCRKNFKNTAIKTCGHVFCDECVQERIAARSRKCPNCNKSFGSNDYMRVTL